jgi:hypothetical protein
MTGRPPKPLTEIAVFKNLDFSIFEIKIVESILEDYSAEDAKNIRKIIAKLKTYDVPLHDLKSRLEKIAMLGRDSSSLLSLQLRYGDDEGQRLFHDKNARCAVTRASLEERLGKEATDKILSGRGASLKNYTARHGEVEGKQRWDDYCRKRSAAYAQKHRDGYQFARYTLNYYIDSYGNEKGHQVYSSRKAKKSYKSSRQRYIDEFGEELGTEICRRKKTTVSKQSFIERYGEKAGLVKYENYLDKNAKNRSYSYQSKAATSFFTIMVETLGLDPDKCRFGLGREKIIYLTPEERVLLPQRIMALDFLMNKKVIEYNGDCVHANPRDFQANDTPHPWDKKITAAQMWQRDALKDAILRDRGYNVLVLWESDATKNIDKTMLICKKYLESDDV